MLYIFAAFIAFSAGNVYCQPPDSSSFADEPEEVFLNFSYDRVVNTIVVSYYSDNSFYLPINEVFKQLRINYAYSASDKTFTGNVYPEDSKFTIDVSNLQAEYNGTDFALSKNDVIVKDSEVYLKLDKYKSIFNFGFEADIKNLSLGLATDQALPVLVIYQQTSRRENLKKYSTEVKAPLIYKRERNKLNVGFIDYTLSGNYNKFTKPFYNYDINTGSEVFGGDLRTSFNGFVQDRKLENARGSALWQYDLEENILLNQIAVGHQPTNGFYTDEFLGAYVTNIPRAPRVFFENYPVIYRTIPDAEVELYFNNQLFDFAKADRTGYVRFEIPLTYGSNNVYLKIYNPSGEVSEDNVRIQIPTGFLPGGEVNYELSAGETRLNKYKFYAGSLLGGITNWLSNKTGVEYIRGNGYNEPVIYNSLSARLFSQYLFNYTLAPKLYNQLSFNATYYSQISYGLTYTRYKENPFYNPLKIKEEVNFNGALPVNLGSIQFVSNATSRYAKYETTESFYYNFEQNFIANGIRAYINYSHLKTDNLGIQNSYRLLGGGFLYVIPSLSSLVPFLNGNLLTGKIDYDLEQKRFDNLNLSFASNITHDMRLQFNYYKSLTSPVSDFNLQLVMDLPYTKSYVNVNKNSVSTVLSGNIGIDPYYDKLLFYNRQYVGTGAVTFRPYHDANGNSVYDTGEKVIEDVKMDLNQATTLELYENKYLRATGLIPVLKYTVAIDEESLKDPLLVPKYKRFSFESDPNVYKKIDIPFYMTREISGKVILQKEDLQQEMQGITVYLKNEETGEITPLSTYFDGSFYHIGLLPGRYSVHVRPEVLRNLNAVSVPEKIEFEYFGDDEKSNIPDELQFILQVK